MQKGLNIDLKMKNHSKAAILNTLFLSTMGLTSE